MCPGVTSITPCWQWVMEWASRGRSTGSSRTGGSHHLSERHQVAHEAGRNETGRLSVGEVLIWWPSVHHVGDKLMSWSAVWLLAMLNNSHVFLPLSSSTSFVFSPDSWSENWARQGHILMTRNHGNLCSITSLTSCHIMWSVKLGGITRPQRASYSLLFLIHSGRCSSLFFPGMFWSHSHLEAAQYSHSLIRRTLSSSTGAVGVKRAEGRLSVGNERRSSTAFHFPPSRILLPGPGRNWTDENPVIKSVFISVS